LIDNHITWDSATMRDDAATCIADVTWDSVGFSYDCDR